MMSHSCANSRRMSSRDCYHGVILDPYREIYCVVTGGVSGVIFNSTCTHCIDRRVL